MSADRQTPRRRFDRGSATVPRVERPIVSITWPTAGLVVIGVAVAAVQLLVLDPRANDGAAMMIAAAGVPMVVVAACLQLLVHHVSRNRRARLTFLWWLLGALPIALLALAVPGVQRAPDYYDVQNGWDIVGALGITAFLIVLGLLLGPVLWFFVVMPLTALVAAIIRIVRREKNAAVGLVMPLVLLAVTAVIVIGALAVDLSDALPGRAGGIQVIWAILGVPGVYAVDSEPLLWVVRVIVAVIVLAFVAPWWRGRRARRDGCASMRADAASR